MNHNAVLLFVDRQVGDAAVEVAGLLYGEEESSLIAHATFRLIGIELPGASGHVVSFVSGLDDVEPDLFELFFQLPVDIKIGS